MTALQSLQSATVGRPSAATVPSCSPGELAECVRTLATLRSAITEKMLARLAASSRWPLALSLSREYGWSEVELDAFVTLVLIQSGHASHAWVTICLDDVDDGVGDAKLLRLLSGMSALVTLQTDPNPRYVRPRAWDVSCVRPRRRGCVRSQRRPRNRFGAALPNPRPPLRRASTLHLARGLRRSTRVAAPPIGAGAHALSRRGSAAHQGGAGAGKGG
eukprot:2526345-Prymnesium_polylepis.1